MNFFFEIHKGNPQEGPGSDECTERAFRVIADRLPGNLQVLDIGCGPGRQTMMLAKLMSEASIKAFDKYPQYLDQLNASIKERGLLNIVTINGSMDDLPFKETYDLIWSEGALYIMGVENALNYLKKFIKPDGFLVFSDLVWIKPDAPNEIKTYMEGMGVAVVSQGECAAMIEKNSYVLEEQFVIPEDAWLVNYYGSIAKRLEVLDKQYGDDPEYQKAAAAEHEEVDIYRKYKEWYGYVFYVCRRR